MHPQNDRRKYKLWKIYFSLLLLAWVSYLILCFPTLTSHEIDAGLIAGVMYIQLFIAAVLMMGSYVIYRKLRSTNQRALKAYGRVMTIGWIIIFLFVAAWAILSEYAQHKYEEHYQPFTQQEIVNLIRDCQITQVTSDNESWKRVYLKNGEDRLVDGFDLHMAEEEMGHIVCTKGVNIQWINPNN